MRIQNNVGYIIKWIDEIIVLKKLVRNCRNKKYSIIIKNSVSELNDRLDTIEGSLKELEDQYEEITHNTELSNGIYENATRRYEGEHKKIQNAFNVSSSRIE